MKYVWLTIAEQSIHLDEWCEALQRETGENKKGYAVHLPTV